MRQHVPLSAVFSGILVLGCAGSDYYYSEDEEVSLSVTVTPVPAEEPGPLASGSAEPSKAVAPAADLGGKDFVKALPPNPLAGRDGLERHLNWNPLEWDNPCEASVWKRSQATDDVVLTVSLKGGESDKAAVSREVKLSLAESGTLRVDVYNSTPRQIPVAFAVFSSVDRVYSESTAKKAGPGWTHLEFDLAEASYKTAASAWKHTAGIWGRKDVREIVLLFYSMDAGALAVDRLEVDVQTPPEVETKPQEPPPSPPDME